MPPSRFNGFLPRFSAILAAQQLLHAALLNEVDADAAVKAIDADLARWRRVLAGTNPLLTK